MTNEELFETVQALIDDCAAVTSSSDAERLANLLRNLATAARLRADAIKRRDGGRITVADNLEHKSEQALDTAKKYI